MDSRQNNTNENEDVEAAMMDAAIRASLGNSFSSIPQEQKPSLRNMAPTGKTSGLEDSKKMLHWDETTIAKHDQLRGTRMKIEEPKTPYHYLDEEENEEVAENEEVKDSGATAKGTDTDSWGKVLHEKLVHAAATRQVEDAADAEEEERRRAFRQRRKQHYDEMEAVRNFRAMKQAQDDEDEDEEND